MMGTRSLLFLGILVIFLEGCVTGYTVLEGNVSNDSTDDDVSSDHEAAPAVAEAASVQKANEQHLRRMEALGFGIFNYSVLTKETCDGHYEEIRDQLRDIEEDIVDGEETLEGKRHHLEDLQEQLAELQQSGNEHAIENLQDGIHDQEEEFGDYKDKLEDLRVLYDKHLIIKNEIKKYCLAFKAGA